MIRDNAPIILTRSGLHVTPLELRAEDVRLEDIAASLSKQCRFTGHTNRFYSVAQHCWIVSHLVEYEYAIDGLMHDAPEYVLHDMVRPLKVQPDYGFHYRLAETRVQQVIARVFSLAYPEPPEVKVADRVALATEARDLMPHATTEWEIIQGVRPMWEEITPWDPDHAEAAFLARYHEIRPRRST